MSRTLDEVGLATELWSPAVEQRFQSLFAVAARKSLMAWHEVPAATAQVLVLDGSQPVLASALQAPCVVYVGGAAQRQPLGQSAQRWVAHLNVDFTLSDLIDMLDRAGVFLLDWRARQQAVTHHALERALADVRHQGLECGHRFEIKAWVSLQAPWDSPECTRALALLSRGMIDTMTLCTHSGLAPADAAHFLGDTALRAVLRCELNAPVAPQRKSAPAAPQWLQRLSGWISRGGRA